MCDVYMMYMYICMIYCMKSINGSGKQFNAENEASLTTCFCVTN